MSASAGEITLNLVFVVLGIAMLFVPLRGIHLMMSRVKEEEQAKLTSRGRRLLTEAAYEESGGEPSL